jgi:hypothetical protein
MPVTVVVPTAGDVTVSAPAVGDDEQITTQEGLATVLVETFEAMLTAFNEAVD